MPDRFWVSDRSCTVCNFSVYTRSYDEAYENNYLNQATENHHGRAKQPVHNRK